MEGDILAFAEAAAKTNPILAYFFFFINAVLQVIFPPYPGDSVVIFQGYLSSRGILSPALLFMSTFAGTLLSSHFLYAISQKYGVGLIEIKFFKKYFHTERVYGLEKWFNKYGAPAIIVSKFIPGIGSLTLIGAGLFKLKAVPALVSIFFSSLLRSIFLFMTGQLAGENLELIKEFITQYQNLLLLLILIAAAIYIYFKYFGKKK